MPRWRLLRSGCAARKPAELISRSSSTAPPVWASTVDGPAMGTRAMASALANINVRMRALRSSRRAGTRSIPVIPRHRDRRAHVDTAVPVGRIPHLVLHAPVVGRNPELVGIELLAAHGIRAGDVHLAMRVDLPRPGHWNDAHAQRGP